MIMDKIDLEQLRLEVRGMTRQKGIYKVLREELTALGYWKQQPRGIPFKKGNTFRLTSKDTYE